MSGRLIWLWFRPNAAPVRGRIELNLEHSTLHLLLAQGRVPLA